VANDRFGLRQPPAYLDNVGDGTLAERANDLCMLSELDFGRRGASRPLGPLGIRTPFRLTG
jgi:hypothetical protein